MSDTLGIIRSGNIGGAVAKLAVDAGIDVVLSNSRGLQSLGRLVEQFGPRARAANRMRLGLRGSGPSAPLRSVRSQRCP